MAMSAIELQLRDMMKCTVCQEVKEHQKQLACQHTLCLECLDKLEMNAAKFSCPHCDQKFLVPNGGLKALPDSLWTKQLTGLIHSDVSTSSSPKACITQQTPAEKKRACKATIAKGTEVLTLAEKKLDDYVEMEKGLTRRADVLKEKLKSIRDEVISRLNTQVDRKTFAIDEAVKVKKEEVMMKRLKLKEAYTQSDALINKLEEEGPVDDMNAELSKAQASLRILKDKMQTDDSTKDKLRQGDSVKLSIEMGELEQSFLEDDVDHSSVGYIFSVDDDGDCKALFPGNSTWCGKVELLERSNTKHDLPTVGDTVRVKPSIEKPSFDWGKATHQSIGILNNIERDVAGDDRVVEVNFPENRKWKGLFKELEKTPPLPLQVGDKVWMAKDVSEPARGWSGVTPVSVGTILNIDGDDVLVKFPECAVWQGLLPELEKIRSIIPGDTVKVKKEVETPTTLWAGVTHQDEGEVLDVTITDKKEELAHIKMPNRPVPWKCLVKELDIVKRCLSTKAASRKIEINLGEMLAGQQSLGELLEENQRLDELLEAQQRQMQECNNQ